MTTTNWFNECKDDTELKARYRDLVKQHHPDLGGDTATMQEINAEYEARMRGSYTARENSTDSSVNWWADREKEMMAILAELLKIDGIEIEIIGVWIWITGDTRAAKDTLKSHGCRWSRDKVAWYWRSAEHKWTGKRKNAPRKDLDGLRATWGTSGTRRGRHSDTATEPFRLTA